ncbi:MAG: tyrosine-type recombinase/integrase [Hyphomicrobiaceae bacterium]
MPRIHPLESAKSQKKASSGNRVGRFEPAKGQGCMWEAGFAATLRVCFLARRASGLRQRRWVCGRRRAFPRVPRLPAPRDTGRGGSAAGPRSGSSTYPRLFSMRPSTRPRLGKPSGISCVRHKLASQEPRHDRFGPRIDPLDFLKTQKKIRLPKQKRLPQTLSHAEVQRILGAIDNPIHRGCFSLIYACGLRISEAATLPVTAIDKTSGLLRVVGKGNKERLVPGRPR